MSDDLTIQLTPTPIDVDGPEYLPEYLPNTPLTCFLWRINACEESCRRFDKLGHLTPREAYARATPQEVDFIADRLGLITPALVFQILEDGEYDPERYQLLAQLGTLNVFNLCPNNEGQRRVLMAARVIEGTGTLDRLCLDPRDYLPWETIERALVYNYGVNWLEGAAVNDIENLHREFAAYRRERPGPLDIAQLEIWLRKRGFSDFELALNTVTGVVTFRRSEPCK